MRPYSRVHCRTLCCSDDANQALVSCFVTPSRTEMTDKNGAEQRHTVERGFKCCARLGLALRKASLVWIPRPLMTVVRRYDEDNSQPVRGRSSLDFHLLRCSRVWTTFGAVCNGDG